MPNRRYVAPKSQAPFNGASLLHVHLNETMALMIDWTAATNDTFDMGTVLDAAQLRIGTSAITLYRLVPGAMRPRVIAHTTPDGRSDTASSVSGAMAEFVLERHAASAGPGTVWRLSELRDDPQFATSRAFREYLHRPETAEVTLMIMANEAEGFDVLELQFAQSPPKHDVLRAELLSTALAHSWAQRQDGLCARMIVEHSQRNRAAATATDRTILASDNPYNLSRSEFRICGLIGQGLRAREIAAELSLSEATVRTHLRNIYAKTEANGQIEVLSRLRAQQTNTETPRRMSAAAR